MRHSSHVYITATLPHRFDLRSPSLSSFTVAVPCLLLLACLASFPCPALSGLNRFLQAGRTANSRDIISDGTFIESSLSAPLRSWQPFPTLYLWLSDSTAPPVRYRVLLPANQQPLYEPLIVPAPGLNAKNNEYISVYPLNGTEEEEQAVLMASGGVCAVAVNTTAVDSAFVLNTDSEYDDVLISFTHDCIYPRVNIGRPPATNDVLQFAVSAPPQLTPNAGVQLSVAANTGAELELHVRVVDIGDQQWLHDELVPFTVSFTASNDELAASTLITPEVEKPQFVTISEPLLTDPTAFAMVAIGSSCSDPANSGYITLQINFLFQRSIELPINITCQPSKRVAPLRTLSVDLLPGAQFVGTAVRTPIAVNGAVPTSSSFNVQPPAGRPYTFVLPQRYVTLSIYNNFSSSSNRTITGQLIVSGGSDGNWIVGMAANSAPIVSGDRLPFTLQSSKLTVVIETQCQTSQQLQTTTVLISSLTDGVVFDYDPIEFNYQWLCQQQPLFALSTVSPKSQSAANLIDMSQPSTRSAGSEWEVDTNAPAGVINVNFNIQAPLEGMVGTQLYLTLQSGNATMFAWTFDSGSSLGLSDASFAMQGSTLQAGSMYKTIIPLSASSGTLTSLLLLDRLVCTQREYVQVTTRLTYGWQSYVNIIYNRHCEQADQFDNSVALSSGAVAAIVLLVLASAACVMGCGWRYSSKGKRGWEMLPFYDVWGRVQDSALGPKRYTGPQMTDEDLDGMTEVEISSTGGYGSTVTSYQNDL